jgi:hypothetical protein
MSKTKIDLIKELYYDEEFLIADGFDEAIIGVDEKNVRIVYDVIKIINILIQDGMSFDEAFEFYHYNIAGAYVGDKTPLFIQVI